MLRLNLGTKVFFCRRRVYDLGAKKQTMTIRYYAHFMKLHISVLVYFHVIGECEVCKYPKPLQRKLAQWF
jgi:hypothetical protein